MRNACRFVLVLSVLVVPLGATAENPARTATGEALAERRAVVPLISPRELVQRIQSGDEITFIDVREPEEFAQNHIPGAINIPQRQLAERADEIPKRGLVIPYCNMDFRGFVAARELESLGAESAALMRQRGILGWEAQGLPIVSRGGLSDAEALEQLREAPLEGLVGDVDVRRVERSGRVEKIEIEVANWYYHPNDLVISAGDELEIELTSTQGHHYFVLPDYEVSVALVPGETRIVRFVADQPGEFRFGSCEWDGGALQVMKGRLRVNDPKGK